MSLISYIILMKTWLLFDELCQCDDYGQLFRKLFSFRAVRMIFLMQSVSKFLLEIEHAS